MLRVHIDPRTVMTIENQIPKIIVGIILVTFSFAIAGLLIDLMYVAIYLGGAILMPLIDKCDPSNSVRCLSEAGGVGGGFGGLANASDPFQAAGQAFDWFALMGTGKEAVENLASGILRGHYAAGASPGIVELFLDMVKTLLAILISLIAWFLIFLALLFTLIRLFVAILVAYISILLDIIFAPFWLIIGLLPGSSLGAGAWFKDMIANLSVFPATIVMLVLANFFMNIPVPAGTTLFTPPLVGGGYSAEAFGQLIALGFIFMTPSVLTLVKQALKAPKVAFGPALEPLGAAGGTVGSAISAGVTARTSPLPPAGQPGGLTAVIRKFARA